MNSATTPKPGRQRTLHSGRYQRWPTATGSVESAPDLAGDGGIANTPPRVGVAYVVHVELSPAC
eukprot:11222767-Lingulodinium_polyedra.AAC.1